jgi:hypothetical protein
LRLEILGHTYHWQTNRSTLSKDVVVSGNPATPPRPPELSQPLPPDTVRDTAQAAAPIAEVSEVSEQEQALLATPERPNHPMADKDKPVLPVDRPDWVARSPQVQGEVHFVSVGLDQYVYESKGAAIKLEQLNSKWIRANWWIADRNYDALIETPSATYHQAWTELRIDEKQRRLAKNWRNDAIRQDRIVGLGLGAGTLVGVVSLAHAVLGIGARRKVAPK